MPLLILVADDNPGVLLAITDYLELLGYSVIAARDGQEAIERLETYHPHLMIADIKMPRKNGYELVKQVRQRPQFRLLPVVFLTQRNSTEERILGYQAGCDVYLPKPFEMEELGAVIRNLLERSQIVQSELRFSSQNSLAEVSESKKPPPLPLPESFHLTEREQQVLELLAMGLSNIEIGQKLHLSHRTIEKYVSSLLRKTDTNNRSELVRFALDRNLVE